MQLSATQQLSKKRGSQLPETFACLIVLACGARILHSPENMSGLLSFE